MRRTAVAAAGLLLVGLAAGCSGDDDKPDAKCVDAVCHGKIGSAAYGIQMPETWNGTLLLYSHGYRIDGGKGPGPSALSPGDAKGRGGDDVSEELLSKGYALAGSSYSTGGWAVADAVRDADNLRAEFVKRFGKPKFTVAWGTSLGGLVTQVLAESRAWVSAAAPMCAPLAGPDLFVDGLYTTYAGVRALLVPGLQLAGWTDPVAALKQVTAANQAIVRAAKDTVGGGAAKVLYLAASAGLPTTTGQASDAQTRATVAAQSLAQFVSLSATIRFEMQKRFGGQVARFTPPGDPGATIGEDVAQDISSLRGSAAGYAAAIAKQRPPATDDAARAKLTRSGTTTGALRVPTLTMHTVLDPIVVVAHETIFRNRVDARGAQRRLEQTFIAPPASANGGKAPYGVGHCEFSTDQMVGVAESADAWARTGRRPEIAALNTGFGGGVQSRFTPPKWPSGATR